MAAREAIRLDPRYAGGYSALADMRTLRGNRVEADGLFQQALALDPADPDTLTSQEIRTLWVRFGSRRMRRFAGPSGSRRSCARSALSITGALRAGLTSAVRWAPDDFVCD
jgi:hypothetical protein